MSEGELQLTESFDLPVLRAQLQEVYARLEREIQRASPRCEISGRCCRFEEYGHTLFLSAPEAVLLVADAPGPVRPLDEGLTCPWQDRAGRCAAREARPLGCRVYFCDPEYQERMSELAEEYVRVLKRLTEANGWPWSYGTLARHLRLAVEEGRLQAGPGTAQDC